MSSAINGTDKKKIYAHLIEFFFIGLVMGIIEDLLAIHFATDAEITLETVWIAFFIALPFAVISEIVVDQKILRKAIRKMKAKWRKNADQKI